MPSVRRNATARRWPEVAKVERHNDRRLAVHSGGCDVAILFIVCHLGNQGFVTADPCVAEMGAQFSFQMSGQRTPPSKFHFQCAGCLPNNLDLEPGRLRDAQEGIAQRKVGKDAGVQDHERCARHSLLGISTRS